MLHDDNYKSTFDCTIYYRVTGIAILRYTISDLSALGLSALLLQQGKRGYKNHSV